MSEKRKRITVKSTVLFTCSRQYKQCSLQSQKAKKHTLLREVLIRNNRPYKSN